jgi:hypothetical protein
MTNMNGPTTEFNMKRDDGQMIPVRIYMAQPLTEAYSIRIERTIQGADTPYVNLLLIERTLTGEYVLINEELAPVTVVRDDDELLRVLRDVILPRYDGDLVEKIEVWVA